ncbi:hypothetical protein AA0311_2746 [Asaia bogorensis NBRC 16594]|uniref:Uncharacterized protein n=1 Tax=Asaia bogorensis NBRC 16594 TaxID=1231624 RepID=A0AAN4U352_9PROT|nr:hypothetical protein AA0311_2746 [Asaia bogorensis NBRC 16594]GEL54102.1 hypothetical protein ABO01nite_21090 [Asaia bogorensis NBRC 16594]
MTMRLIGPEQGVLFLGGNDGTFGHNQIGVVPAHPAHGAIRDEFRDREPDRDAGLATMAYRGIDNAVAAPETGTGQAIVKLVDITAGQLGHDLALRPAGEIRAGRRLCRVEELGTMS